VEAGAATKACFTTKHQGSQIFTSMPFEPLYSRLPELAEAETRSALVQAKENSDLPAACYSFVEMFCNEPGCDCRRGFFTVSSSATKQPEAVIAYGWESASFYRNWFKYAVSKDDIAELIGPVLNMGSPQGRHAPAILNLFTEALLPDRDYIERIKRHYKLFRATVGRR
jgi:hypothetical protein